MTSAGVGVGSGVVVWEGMNSRERVRCAMGWAEPPLEVSSCTLGDCSRLWLGVGCCKWRVVFDMGRVRVRVS